MDDLDPIKRFNRIWAAQSQRVVQAPIAPSDIERVITSAQSSNEDPSSATVNYLAFNTALTKADAQQVVSDAGGSGVGGGTPDPKQVAAGAAALTGFGGEVALSDPVMLWPAARVVFGAIFAITLFLSLLFANDLANKAPAKQPESGWAYGALGIGAAVSVLGILILVMGYKSVTIKGNGPAA